MTVHVARALRHRDFRLFFIGQFISLCGTWMQTVAQSWLIYRLTDSATLLGVTAFVSQIPVFLSSPLGGVVADQHDKRKVLLITQICSMILACALATLTLFELVQIWHVLVLAALLGIVNGFDIPARQAFVIKLVGKEDLLNAVALNSSIFHAARVVGPAIGGLIVAAAGEGVCFSLNALSYLAVIAGLLSIQTRETIAKNPEGSTPLSRIQEGVAFAWHKRPIRALLCLVGFVSLVGMPYIVLMPIFAEKVLHSGSHGFGLLVASSGIGAMLGALYLAARRGTDGLGNLLVTGTLLFGIFLIAFSQSGHLWLSVALIIPSGATMMCVLASSNTLLQIMVSDELRGRVMSVYAMMFMGSAPLSSLISGALAEHIGAPWTVTLGGICTVLGGCALWKILPPLQSEAQQLILAQQMVGGHPGDEVSESWGQSNISYSLDKEQE